MTPICFTHTKMLFLKVNNELHKSNQWFISNKLSLNVKIFFHKRSKQDDIPLSLPKLEINTYEIKQAESIKYLGVLLDESSTWKPHIKYIESKIAKNLREFLKAKPFLNKQFLLSLYCSYIHSYINYANVTWVSTYMTNLKNCLVKKACNAHNLQQRKAFFFLFCIQVSHILTER